MHASFDFTHDEATEVVLAAHARSATLIAQRRRNALVSALSGAGVAALLGSRTLPTPVWIGLAALAAGLAAMAEWALLPGRLRAMVGRQIREQLPGPGPFPFLAALEPEGLFITQNGVSILYPWEQVAAVRNDAAWGVEFHGPTGLTVLVRDRAFADPGARAAFADRAETLRRGGRQAWGPDEARP